VTGQGEEPTGLDGAGSGPVGEAVGKEAPGVGAPDAGDGVLADADGDTDVDDVAVGRVRGAQVRSAGAVVAAGATGVTSPAGEDAGWTSW
jgi:hypothetical protein